MKVLVVDDEAPARERLCRLLAGIPGVQVAGEAANGREALERVAELAPDAVLLDIHMPGMDGLEAARHLAQLPEPPAVVFTTAYGEFALQAFEAQAVDYLLKPVRAERLAQALHKARRLSGAEVAALAPDRRARTHLSATVHGALRLVPVEDILYFQADQKYVTVRHRGGQVLIEDSLKALEDEFGDAFVRIHRNALVARHALRGLEGGEGHYRVRLADVEETLEVSRRHAPELRRLLRGGVL
ncbi:MAG: LytR/AlgR family response regulator transcription factor [Thiohalomonadaceae bacterium]